MSLIEIEVAAVLFDMDGVLVDSIEADEAKWRDWATGQGVDPKVVLEFVHGVPNPQIIAHFRPDLNQEQIDEHVRWIEQRELEGVDLARGLPGAKVLVDSIPNDRRAVFTSAQRDVALGRLAAAGMTDLPVLLTPADVQQGKPSPDGYLLAAQRLGADIRECLVIEDSVAGTAAGKAAGARVLGLATSHSDTTELHADWVRKDLSAVLAEVQEKGLILRF